MAKLSAVIPSRDEKFLLPTIHDLMKNARGEFECIAVLDSDKWPEGWKEITDQYPNLHTIHNGRSLGMRASINRGAASAISRGAKFIMKSDGHCSFSEGFDEILKAECEPNWVVVPRRGRLDPENWVATETHKPDIDYHYLSFPDNPQDWGGKGLNGKPWPERAVERKDILLDEEMSSQGSCWFMQAAYFNDLGPMDDVNYGTFWNEFQEWGMKCWLSGGKVMVNKKAKYLHLHKGKTYGRGYHLKESELQTGASFTKNWIYNEAWDKQTLPFSWLIEHFWPVPSWPDNWEEILYATRKPKTIAGYQAEAVVPADTVDIAGSLRDLPTGLVIHSAVYGYDHEHKIDVVERVRQLVKGDSLDIVVNNSTLTPGENPFRGKKKTLSVQYSFDGGEKLLLQRQEKDWLIIGPVVPQRAEGPHQIGMDVATGKDRSVIMSPEIKYEVHDDEPQPPPLAAIYQKQGGEFKEVVRFVGDGQEVSQPIPLPLSGTNDVITVRRLDSPPTTAAALNDYLIRRFSISPQRLRGPMPIELRDFHRDDLAQLFAELGFKRIVEVGVAEGRYSEVLLKANPDAELLLVDPWTDYQENPQAKGSNRHKYAFDEVQRKIAGYENARMIQATSMEAVRDIEWNYLDAAYIDGNHLFDYVCPDLIEWSKRVRSGGIVSGDDYYALDQKRWVGGGVVEAVQAYVNAHRIPIWFLCSGHKSVDYFWCKP